MRPTPSIRPAQETEELEEVVRDALGVTLSYYNPERINLIARAVLDWIEDQD